MAYDLPSPLGCRVQSSLESEERLASGLHHGSLHLARGPVPVLGVLPSVLSPGCHDNFHTEAVSGEGAGRETGVRMLIKVGPSGSQDFNGINAFCKDSL